VHGAGGVAVLAHPGHLKNYRAIVEKLVPMGLDGLEVFYYDHTPEVIADLRQLAVRHNLIMTVGSDFHRRDGDGSARLGSVKVPSDVNIHESLLARARQN
jgi:3',5'-nucleoside bisphosphate phosphatase